MYFANNYVKKKVSHEQKVNRSCKKPPLWRVLRIKKNITKKPKSVKVRYFLVRREIKKLPKDITHTFICTDLESHLMIFHLRGGDILV